MPLYKGDIGNTLSMTLQRKEGRTTSLLDLTGAEVFFLLEKPSGTVVEVAATVSSPKSGVASYTTATGVINESGEWNWQARIEFADGSVWHGPQDSFTVHDILVESA